MSPYHIICAIDTNGGTYSARHPEEGCSEPTTSVIGSFKSLNDAAGKTTSTIVDYNKKHKEARAIECVLIKGDIVRKDIIADWHLEQ